MKFKLSIHSGNPTLPFWILPLLALSLFTLAGNLCAREIAGWVEKAKLIPSGIELKAKLDSGAKHSSINAMELEYFEVDGVEHVRFKVINKAGETVEVTEPVIREASIKRHFGKAQKRSVVRLTICVGSITKAVEVNLVDRAGFNYPMLIGRSYLTGDFLIDPGKTYLLETACPEVQP